MISNKNEIAQMRNNLMSAVIDRYENGENWRFCINLILVVGGGAIAAFGKLGAFSEPHSTWISVIGLVMVLVGGALVAFFDRKRTDLTKSAKEALEKCDEFENKIGDLVLRIERSDLLDQRRRFLLTAIKNMHEAVERLPHSTKLQTVIEAMLDAGSSDLQGACGFDAGERWTFSIFERQKETDNKNAHRVMRRVAVSWADRAAEKDAEPRFWKKKEGFTGAAWQSDKEIIEADLRVPEVAAEYPIPLSKSRQGDAEKYVSVAVIPIRLGRDDDMWGTVTATSDQPDRWRRGSTDPREQNVMVVRLIAQLVAMQVALRNGYDAK